jgi:hypothetical protein
MGAHSCKEMNMMPVNRLRYPDESVQSKACIHNRLTLTQAHPLFSVLFVQAHHQIDDVDAPEDENDDIESEMSLDRDGAQAIPPSCRAAD